MNRLEDYVVLSQQELFSKLRRMFKSTAVYSKDGYILVPGEAPIMLLAHLDTVHRERVKQICKTENGVILMSPQGIGGDDRCGVYALVRLHRTAVKKPWLLFTCDEETGGGGATKFCTHYTKGKLPKGLADLKLLVEIDRTGEDDAVYYDCENDDFEDYITSKGFTTAWGTFSDISIVAPKLKVAAVNLSSGYYNAHTLHEYINRNQLNAVVKKVGGIIADSAREDFPKYEYVESKYNWDHGLYGGSQSRQYGRGFGGVYTKDYILPKTDADIHHESTIYYEEEADLAGVPLAIRGYYLDLLDMYSCQELDAFRLESGDGIIKVLYESEMGCYPKDEPDDEWEGDLIGTDDRPE